MIGWYQTGPKLCASYQEINDLFKRIIVRPVMVIVDNIIDCLDKTKKDAKFKHKIAM